LIHDTARQLVARESLEQSVSAFNGHDGVILSHGPMDTMIDISDKKPQYLQRDDVSHVETQQTLKHESILNAYAKLTAI
jgi:2-C-methyl-D-erythritol 4-phosphate cytidylyltransferase